MIRRGGRALVLALGIATVGCGGSSGTPADGGSSEDAGGGSAGSGGGAAGSSGGSAGSGGGATVGPHGCTNIQVSCTSNGGLSCEEWAGYDAVSVANFMKSCNHPNQVLSMGPCDTSASVGGCGIVAPRVCAVSWANPPVTAADSRRAARGRSQMFVTPP